MHPAIITMLLNHKPTSEPMEITVEGTIVFIILIVAAVVIYFMNKK